MPVGENREPWIALLSDTHIDADLGKEVRGVNMADQLSVVVERLLSGPRPFAVLANGDMSRDTGEVGDYVTLHRLLQPIYDSDVLYQLTMGNHDHRAKYHQSIQEAYGGRPASRINGAALKLRWHNATLDFDATRWLMLNSLRETDEIAGELGLRQREWLSNELDAQPNTPTFILVHHQPEDPQDPDDDGFGLADGAALLEMLRERQQVKAIFHGHRHAWTVREAHGIHIVGLPATSYVFAEGETAGYVEARVRPDHLQLTRRCVDPQDPAEGQTHRLAYR